ncbi:hypothetical protein [Methylobacterium sp. JK268]
MGKVLLVMVIVGAAPGGGDNVNKLQVPMELEVCREVGPALVETLRLRAPSGRKVLQYCEPAPVNGG